MKTKPITLTKGGVLLVASDARLQETARATLEADNYEVVRTVSRDEARELLDARSTDILVLDVDHESESLGRLLAQLKAQRPHLRIIGIREPQDQVAKVHVAGANVWMEKPVGPTRLVTTVNSLLAELRSETFRKRLFRRQTAPFRSSVPPGAEGMTSV